MALAILPLAIARSPIALALSAEDLARYPTATPLSTVPVAIF